MKAIDVRPFTGYLRIQTLPNVNVLATNASIDDELWSLLDYYAEIEKVGIGLVKKHGFTRYTQYERIYKSFRAFIRQAKNYYLAGKALNYRSSGLLYYYSFLNLAKAYILLRKPNSIRGKFIAHGLSNKIPNYGKFENQTIKIEEGGIFPMLYEYIASEKILTQPINIQTCLAYCSDVSYQYSSGGFGQARILPGKFALIVNEDDKSNKKCWGMLAISSFGSTSAYSKSFSDFYKNYELIDLTFDLQDKIFGINGALRSHYSYFQSKKETPYLSESSPNQFAIMEELKTALHKVLDFSYYQDDSEFMIALPYKIRRQISMRETLAIYITMFYMSSLIRYKPDYLDHLLDKKEAWILESFVKSCPQTFLRSMASHIIGQEFIFTQR